MATARDLVFKALSGGAQEVTTSSDLRSQLLALAGPSAKTKSGVDLKAAAEKLQCSPQTVRRWLRPDTPQTPSKKHQASLNQAVENAYSTPEGRRTALAAAGGTSGAKAPRKITISAYQGPGEDPGQYFRHRSITFDVNPDQYQSLLNAYETGGTQGFMAQLENVASHSYYGNWHIDADKIEQLDFS